MLLIFPWLSPLISDRIVVVSRSRKPITPHLKQWLYEKVLVHFPQCRCNPIHPQSLLMCWVDRNPQSWSQEANYDCHPPLNFCQTIKVIGNNSLVSFVITTHCIRFMEAYPPQLKQWLGEKVWSLCLAWSLQSNQSPQSTDALSRHNLTKLTTWDQLYCYLPCSTPLYIYLYPLPPYCTPVLSWSLLIILAVWHRLIMMIIIYWQNNRILSFLALIN